MTEEKTDEERFSTIVVSSLTVTVVLLLILPMLFVAGKETAYSAYATGDSEIYQLAQLTDMRNNLDDEEHYFIANTMSTPMLVNDWKDPHRTMLLIIGPEKPIDETEAEEIYKFVTEKGGKVIVASDNSNAGVPSEAPKSTDTPPKLTESLTNLLFTIEPAN